MERSHCDLVFNAPYCSVMFRFLLLLLTVSTVAHAADRLNVILFVADDVSWNDLGCYGNAAARTPNIDRLAAQGRRFDEAILVASSCSPSRSSIITGRYPHNNGRASELHQPIAAHLPWFPRLLRESGYYTALVGKHHMTADKTAEGEKPQPEPFDLVDKGTAPDNKGGHATWVKTVQERPKDKPFFFWFAAMDAHRDWDADKDWNEEMYGPKHDASKVIVPPFLQDDAATRSDLASYYNEITRFDHFIGRVVAELKAQAILDDTLILVMADNGRPFPRAKTRLHDSGMKTPFVAHWPKGITKPGAPTRSLVSSIDIAPTILSLAGVPASPTMQGVSFAPLLANPETTVRKYAFSEHNWHDYEAHGRSVRSEGFLYIVNARPQLPWQGPADSVRSPSHASLSTLRDAGQLTPAQADVFLVPRPEIELYSTDADPQQLNNLTADPNYAADKEHLAALMDEWIKATGDSAPADLSKDGFDRTTGESLKIKNNAYRGTPAGWDREASHVNAPGPR
jgi:N-sulfoglucosamine sulfohydrolase